MENARKLYALLTRKQRFQLVILLGLMVLGMTLEMAGITLVVPALALMTRASVGAANPAFGKLLVMLGNPSRERLVVFGMFALVAVYMVKTGFLAFLAWKQARFVYGVQTDMSYRLFRTYLRQPYAFHLQRNSALLIRNAVNEIQVFCHVMLTPLLLLLTEGLVLLGIASLLIAFEPRGATIVIATLGFLALAFHLATDRAVLRWGKARQLHEGRRIQHLQQGLGGIKDVLVLGRERGFLEQYQIHNIGSALASERQETLHQMPRLGLELLAVIALAVLVSIKLHWGTTVDAIIPTIGLFAAAAFRIMPSINRVINSAHNVRYALPVLGTLSEELTLPVTLHAEKDQEPLPFETQVKMVDVAYTYPESATLALDHINLAIARGTTAGFIGGSGAGKSTLVDILLGLLPPDCGRVEVDNSDITPLLRRWQRNIGYVPQAIFLTDDTLRRNIAFGIPSERIDDTAVWNAVKAAQLEEYIAGLPDGLETMVGERGIRLSGGQLQRIGIARALYHDPPVLVLDEATSSLDMKTERGVMQAVRALHGRKTIIIVAHRLSTLRDCDWIFRLEAGRLVGEGDVGKMIGDFGRSGSERVAEHQG